MAEVWTWTMTKSNPRYTCFFDIEAMQDTSRHVANLLIAETEHIDQPEHFRGDDCVKHFLEWLDTLTPHCHRTQLVRL